MDTMVKNDLQHLMQQRDAGPFIAIYLNTDAVLNDLNRRRLQLKQLVADAQQQLAQRFPKASFQPFQAQFDRLANDNSFWLQHTGPQTGLIANAETCLIFDLQTPTDTQVIVNSMPAIRPILADRQQQFDFDLLALNEDSMALYQQRHGELVALDLPTNAPTTLKGTLGTEKRGGDLNFNSSPVHGVNYHGHNAKAEERAVDQRNYYLQVDQYLLTAHSQASQRPLILMGLPHNQAVFRKLSKNPYLSQHLMIERSPNGLSLAEIAVAATPVQNQWRTGLTDILLDRYDQAQSRQRALNDPFDMIRPALDGRIDTLIVAANAQVGGTIKPDGSVQTDLQLPDNLIDDLVDVVMSRQGQVRIIPADRMPIETAALALLRY